LPSSFDGDAQIAMSVLFLFVGFLVIFILERFAPKEEKTENTES